MRKNIFLLACLFIFTYTSAQTGMYTIKGSVANATYEGRKVYLRKISPDYQGLMTADSTVVKNGKFVFKGNVAPEVELAFVGVSYGESTPRLVLLEQGIINLRIDTISSLSGTPKNDDLQKAIVQQNILSNKLDEIQKHYGQAVADKKITPQLSDSSQAACNKIQADLLKLNYGWAEKNMDNQFGEFILLSMFQGFDADQLDHLLKLATPQFKNSTLVEEIKKQMDVKKRTMIGAIFPGIEMQTAEGTTVNLSDYLGKNKIVLVDFWASWCGPCRREIPNIVDAYAKYKKKGFEVVGVSLDNNEQAWKSAIKSLGLTWVQLSDLGGWTGNVAKFYGVQSIPASFLIGKDGRVIAENLRGEDLTEKLANLFDK